MVRASPPRAFIAGLQHPVKSFGKAAQSGGDKCRRSARPVDPPGAGGGVGDYRRTVIAARFHLSARRWFPAARESAHGARNMWSGILLLSIVTHREGRRSADRESSAGIQQKTINTKRESARREQPVQSVMVPVVERQPGRRRWPECGLTERSTPSSGERRTDSDVSENANERRSVRQPSSLRNENRLLAVTHLRTVGRFVGGGITSVTRVSRQRLRCSQPAPRGAQNDTEAVKRPVSLEDLE